MYVDFLFYGESLYCKFAMLALRQSTKEVESRTFSSRKERLSGKSEPGMIHHLDRQTVNAILYCRTKSKILEKLLHVIKFAQHYCRE